MKFTLIREIGNRAIVSSFAVLLISFFGLLYFLSFFTNFQQLDSAITLKYVGIVLYLLLACMIIGPHLAIIERARQNRRALRYESEKNKFVDLFGPGFLYKMCLFGLLLIFSMISFYSALSHALYRNLGFVGTLLDSRVVGINLALVIATVIALFVSIARMQFCRLILGGLAFKYAAVFVFMAYGVLYYSANLPARQALSLLTFTLVTMIAIIPNISIKTNGVSIRIRPAEEADIKLNFILHELEGAGHIHRRYRKILGINKFDSTKKVLSVALYSFYAVNQIILPRMHRYDNFRVYAWSLLFELNSFEKGVEKLQSQTARTKTGSLEDNNFETLTNLIQLIKEHEQYNYNRDGIGYRKEAEQVIRFFELIVSNDERLHSGKDEQSLSPSGSISMKSGRRGKSAGK